MSESMPLARVVIIATSLNPQSRSRVTARYAHGLLTAKKIEADLVDVRDLGDLPLTGSPLAWAAHPELDALKEKLRAATHVLFALPVYNFSVSGVSKNLIELMSANELGGKTVGLMCAAGGPRSYMSVLPFANALMLDFRCWIVPRFVYATRDEVVENEVVSDELRLRIEQLTMEMLERVPK